MRANQQIKLLFELLISIKSILNHKQHQLLIFSHLYHEWFLLCRVELPVGESGVVVKPSGLESSNFLSWLHLRLEFNVAYWITFCTFNLCTVEIWAYHMAKNSYMGLTAFFTPPKYADKKNMKEKKFPR